MSSILAEVLMAVSGYWGRKSLFFGDVVSGRLLTPLGFIHNLAHIVSTNWNQWIFIKTKTKTNERNVLKVGGRCVGDVYGEMEVGGGVRH